MSEFIEELKTEVPEAVEQGKTALSEGADRAQQALEKGKSYVTANPVPFIAGALAFGFVIGLLIPRKKPAPTSLLDGRLDELKELLGSLKSKVSSTAGDSYSDVSTAVGDALKKAKKRFNFC